MSADKLFASIPDDWFEIDHETGNIKFVGPEGEDYKGEPFSIPQFFRWIEAQFNAELVMDCETPMTAFVDLHPPYHLDESAVPHLRHGTIKEEDGYWISNIEVCGTPPESFDVLQEDDDGEMVIIDTIKNR